MGSEALALNPARLIIAAVIGLIILFGAIAIGLVIAMPVFLMQV